MNDAEFESIVARLRAGEKVPHSAHLPLYADTREDRSELSAYGDGFLWTTFFHEYAPGHGWSCEQTEKRALTLEELRIELSK